MSVSLREKFLLVLLLWVVVYVPVFGQGIYVDLNSIPKAGTALIYAHQDDDVIWMLPFWKITEEFIGGAMPPTPRSRTIIQQQQVYMDNNGYGIDYEHNWMTPWGDITDDEYNQYYWIANPAYNYLDLDHLETRLGPDLTPLSITEINKMKAKLEQYIASPSVSRIITHNIWGEYGHAHHLAVNKVVRELAVKYRKDVWMLGCDNGNYINVDIPSGITYTTGRFDSVLFAQIRTIYKTNYYWTSDDYIPPGDVNFIKIVEAGIDKSDLFTDETVTTPGPYQAEPGAYIFDGLDDYLTLAGNNNSSFTISMRVRPDVIKSMDISKMSEYPSSATCDRSFFLQSNGQLTARIFDGQSRTVTSNTILTAGIWTNIVMTGDRSNLKIYINGILEGSVPAGTPANYTTPEFVIGQAQETPSYFQGQISSVKFYDHALTDSEIAILAHSLTISGVTANSKIYDGTNAVTLNKGNSALVGVEPGDAVTLVSSGATGTFADQNVGSGKTVSTKGFTLVGADAAKYTLVQPSLTSDITPANLIVSGVTASDKVYDGTTSAYLNEGSALLGGVIPGDNVLLQTGSAAGTFINSNVGTGKPVSTSGYTISGIDASNYSLTQPSTFADITPVELTISGVTVSDKVYDGTTVAILNTAGATLEGVVSGSVVSLNSSVAKGTFADKNVGTDIVILTSGFALRGSDKGNYTLTQPSFIANITTKELTIGGFFTVSNKEYDGSASATITSNNLILITKAGSDNVNLNATAVFADINVGTGKIVSLTGSSLTGPDALNYTLSLTGAPTTTASIILHSLTVAGVTAYDKVYNGTTNAILNVTAPVLQGISGSDIVNLVSTGATGNFLDKNIGLSKSVITSGFTLTGPDADKYTLIQPQLVAAITPARLTIAGVIANNKVYDGKYSATLNIVNAALSGVFGTDVVNLVSSGATASFVNKVAGTNIAVLVSGFTINGTDNANYTLTQPSLIANIIPAGLTVSGITAGNKVYDGTTLALLNTANLTLTGVVVGDVVRIDLTSVSGIFLNKNAGTGKTVSVSGLTIYGADAANYTLIQPIAYADITPVNLTISGVRANNKVYDGTTSALLNAVNAALGGAVAGDAVNLVTTGATGIFSNKNAGTGKPVSTSGFNLDGTDALNYTLIQPTAIADITPAVLTVSGITAINKVYDGTTLSTLNTENATLIGVYRTDIVELVSDGTTGTFIDKNVGTAKTILTKGFILRGSDSGNYNLVQPATSADISPAKLTVTGVLSLNKVYDGTTYDSLNTGSASLVGLKGDDVVSLVSAGAAGMFADKNVGAGKLVTTYGFDLAGETSENYILTEPSLIAGITAKALTITVRNLSKYYGTALTFTGTEVTISGLVPGDYTPGITLNSPGVAATADIGTYVISVSAGIDINYNLNLVSGNLEVIKTPLTITADDKTRDYRQSNPDLTLSYSGFVLGQDQSIIEKLPVAETIADISSDAGIYDIDVSGAADTNYSFIYKNGTLTINKADQVITFEKLPDGLKTSREYQLKATASSGLHVSFEVSDPNIGNITGDILSIKRGGDEIITAVQEGNNNWKPAPSVPQSVIVPEGNTNIPSLFTPNNDGINDSWIIPNLEQYGNLRVSIYNRYGQAVYQSDNYKNDWYGTWNGNDLPAATYYYIIKSSTKGVIKGVVNIIR